MLFIHTNGSPVKGIPPRPVLKPSMEKNKDRVAASLKKTVDTALRGDADGVLPALKAAGKEGRNVAQKYFTDENGWAPNADITVKGGVLWTNKSGKEMRGKGKGSDRPLIDTGEMRKAITYVIRGK